MDRLYGERQKQVDRHGEMFFRGGRVVIIIIKCWCPGQVYGARHRVNVGPYNIMAHIGKKIHPGGGREGEFPHFVLVQVGPVTVS